MVRDEKLSMTALLAAFLPEVEKVRRAHAAGGRPPHQVDGLVNWFAGLRCVAFAPSFGPDPKRRRAA